MKPRNPADGQLKANSLTARPAPAHSVTVKEQVILVHGTYASSEHDHGEAWWQVGSQAYRELQERLPAQAALVGQGQVFRWSGENSERARSKAAAQLLEFLKAYENEGRPYHLIGHSHGGSVIWSALRLATLRRRNLRQLRSWSTVGTPFLHQRSRSPWSAINLAYACGAAVLLVPTLRLLSGAIDLFYRIATGKLTDGFIIKTDLETGPVVAVIRAPIIKALEMAGVPFTPVERGILVGSFVPEAGQSAAAFMFGSLEGWLIIAGLLLCVYFTLLLFSFCVGPVSEVMRITLEKRVEQRTFQRYGQRWLGLWTKDDEAINGLRKTLELSISFVGSIVPRERIFISDLTGVPSRPLMWVAAPVYNHIIRPFLDATIRNLVVKTAQGNNRPATQVVAVSPHPIDPAANAAPPLPDWLSQRILEQANWHAQEIGHKLRMFLAEPSMLAGLEKFGNQLAGRELVHTSYFDHEEVLDLLAMNIGELRVQNRPRSVIKRQHLKQWLADFRAQQAHEVEHVADSEVFAFGTTTPPIAEQTSSSSRAA